MNGSLKGDLFEWLLEWEEKADLVIVLGTSLSGMNSDRIVKTVSKKSDKNNSLGSVIVSLQKTPLDAMSNIRIFNTLDETMQLLASELCMDKINLNNWQ